MKELILLKCGEIALKGLNRSTFEAVMMKNMRRRLEDLGTFKIWSSQSTIYIQPMEEIDIAVVLDRLKTVFGIVALCRAAIVEKDFNTICQKAIAYLEPQLRTAHTFKVNAKRSDKHFPLASPQICRNLGGVLLNHFPHLKVDLEHPQITVTVEVRESHAYIHLDQIPGAGGMPVGTGGRGVLLLSGGIDSPVAGYMMAKRGLKICAVHFASPPYTSDRARQKVIDLGEALLPYTGTMRLFIVPFTRIQEILRDRCPQEYFTLIMRRVMLRIAEAIAIQEDCGGLITGESVGQVASQTLQALSCTDVVTTLPILRPVIGMDKEEIVAIARKIGTFETSILPYEDCCTIFTPRHPKTKPKPEIVETIETKIALEEELIIEAITQAQLMILFPRHQVGV